MSSSGEAAHELQREPEHVHIGRVTVLDEGAEPVVVDWREPAAEPFYRATPADPHGPDARHRRHDPGRAGPHEMRQRLHRERDRALGPADGKEDRDEFAHVLVDEAQELSPMQWRSVARRCPASSYTIVGDLAQASGPWAPASWEEVVARMPGQRAFSLAELTVNYRTPARAAALAARVLRRSHVRVDPPRAVRDTARTR